MRWREADLEQAVLAELDALKMPTPELSEWFGQTLTEAFEELRRDGQQQKRILARKRTEYEKQNQRLLSLYLQGHVDAVTFQDKSTTLHGQVQEVEKALAACSDIDPACGDMARKVFDFTQNAVEVWHGSKMDSKQRILRAISLNRTLSDTTLCLEKRKPFSLLAERLPVRPSRGDWI